MQRRIAALVFLAIGICQRTSAAETLTALQQPDGILQSVENATIRATGDHWLVTRKTPGTPVELTFTTSQALGVNREQNQWWLLPIGATSPNIEVNTNLWFLPTNAASKDRSWYLHLTQGSATATSTEDSVKVSVQSGSFELSQAEARPHSDPFNHKFSFKIEGGKQLEDALAGFYWGTILPSVVEKTMAAKFPYSSGYVLSTLIPNSYAGSYPAVDHEFQIKGRLAMASEADLDVVRRMIELQFKLMNDDPEGLYRAPCAVQPAGNREYHVRRNSKDNHENAAMFPVTGNIEVMEEAWHYYEARKDLAWLRANILNLEHAASWTRSHIDQYGRLWSDVYYEDQVIKDGRETQAQAFAAQSFTLLANMENALGRSQPATDYTGLAKKLAAALIQPLPTGYWDEKNQRFTDWVDRNGKTHDHIHMLANTLPVQFGYATATQAKAVQRLIDANEGQFERFPSFVAADIAAYDNSEIGSGGPYDLSAAGRYWYWDAAYRQTQNQNDMLLHQLQTVASEAANDNYFMGERYDMDYVYYIDGKNAHGAEKYYEYPNVFAAVLISKLLGLTTPADADVSVAPHLNSYGSVEFGTPEYALRYTYDENGFVLKNLSDKRRRFEVNLSALGAATTRYQPSSISKGTTAATETTVELSPQQEASWVPVR